MRRVLTTMMITMFAFGFCMSMAGCGGEEKKDDKKAETTEKK